MCKKDFKNNPSYFLYILYEFKKAKNNLSKEGGYYIMNKYVKCKNNFHDIYLDLLETHYNEWDYFNSPRGLKQREKIFTNFVLTNPIERVVLSEKRKENIIFNYAEALWYLKGDDSLEYIRYYAPRMKNYSQDGSKLTGTAYGKKIFNYDNCINQWEYIVEELKKDSNSRRCVISIKDPREFLIKDNIDVSCTISMQFLQREDKLHMITTMRSNDLFVGAISDIFSFTLLQEVLAGQLNIQVGNYYHQVGSSHLYEDKIDKVSSILSEKKYFEQYHMNFPKMPTENNWDYIDKVLELEQILRSGKENFSFIEQKKKELPKYWQDVVTLFQIYSIKKRYDLLNIDLINDLNPILKYMVNNLYKE